MYYPTPHFDDVHYCYKERLEMMTMMMVMMIIMVTKPSSRTLQQLLVSVQRRSVAVVRLSTKVAKVLMRRNRDDQDEDENYDNI